jgi:LacI family transcriptional regulator
MDELCEDGIQALVLAPVNEKAVANKINEIISKGIPVVTANTDIENTRRLCYVGSDYEKSGEIVAGLIGLIADGRAVQTVILTGSIHVLGHNQRIIGCNRVIRKSFPNITILDIFETLDDTETAYRVTMNVLQKYKNLDAIYMTAGGVGGTCRALSDAGVAGRIKVFTHDCTAESKPFLENGTIFATISQDPFQQGYQPVKILFDYFLDKQLPESELNYTGAHIMIRESL